MQIGPEKEIIDPGSVVTSQETEPKLTVPENPEVQEAENQEKKDTNTELLHQEANKTETKKETTVEENKSMLAVLYDFLRNNIPLKGAYITAAGHIAAAFAYIFNLDSKEKIDSVALNTSKTILSANCGIQTIEAGKERRLWEALSRFIEPLFIIAEKRVEDLGLARGIGLGISQLVESQDGIYKELCKSKLGIDIEDEKETRKPSMGQDHDVNIDAFKKILKEILVGGVGEDRRFLTGFKWQDMKTELANCVKNFSIKPFMKLFGSDDRPIRERLQEAYDDSGLSYLKKLCVGDDKKDKGHTTALSGYMMIIGSLIGYMDKATKGTLYKLGGSLRNLGGMVADVSIFGSPDTMHNLASPFLTVNGVLDIAQRFIPETMTRAIKAVGNMSMAFYNIGVAIYLNRSNDKTNEKDKISRYDTDLNTKSSNPLTEMVA